MNLTYSLATVTRIIKECVYRENTEGGLLEHVKTIIPIYYNEYGIDEPAIWITQHPTLPQSDKKRNTSQEVTLTTPFQFTCVEWDKDPEIAELKGQELATLVGRAVQKNYLHVQKELNVPRRISYIDINSYLPNGEVSINGRSEKVPCTAIILDVVHKIDWKNCCKEKLNNNGDLNE